MTAPTVLFRTRAVVADRQLQRVRRVVDVHLDPAGAGVLEHVGDRLLDDAIRRQVERGRDAALLAGDLERRLEPGFAGGLQQCLDIVERGLGLTLGSAPTLAQHAKELVQLRQRVARALLDRLEGFSAGAARDARRTGLYRHHADL